MTDLNTVQNAPATTIDHIILDFESILSNGFLSEKEKLQGLHAIFSALLDFDTKEENLHFPTMFSKLAYVGMKHVLSKSMLFYAHSFRKCLEKSDIPLTNHIELGSFVITKLLKTIWQKETANGVYQLSDDAKSIFFRKKENITQFVSVAEGVIINIFPESFTLSFIDEKEAEIVKTVVWNITDRNELFNSNILAAKKNLNFPIPVNLLDVEITDEGLLHPRSFVLQPDFLVDVTAIAECFKDNGSFAMLYLLNKFRDGQNKTPVLLGNIVNYLMEELLQNPETELPNLRKPLFQKFALAFSLLSDIELKDLWSKIDIHFYHIKDVVKNDFPKLNINKKTSFLESTFYSKKYGVQGRLDIFVLDETTRSAGIVELKSGSPWKPNVYGISASHFAQTQLYEMLVRSVYENKIEHIRNYILYSKVNAPSLRFAPSLKPQHMELLKVRNEIILIEILLKKLPEDPKLLAFVQLKNMDYVYGFTAENVRIFAEKYASLDPLEKKYIHHFISLVAGEYSISKIGEHGNETSRGLASLWLDTLQEKESGNAIIPDMRIKVNQSYLPDPKIVFSFRSDQKATNFRKGDIATIYPVLSETNPVLHSPLYKCSISDIGSDYVEVTLRNPQNNQTYFDKSSVWNLEMDLIDSSFHKLYESVFEFMGQNRDYRRLFLGLKAPELPSKNIQVEKESFMTDEQHNLVVKALASKDIFLIWGPPGTGKTNVILKKLAKELFYSGEENFLILAYTNRAVDEICQSIAEIDPIFAHHFVRIGSRISCAAEFHKNLLDQHLQNMENRQEIKQFFASRRVFVSTVSSILGKPELFALKKFETVIIDEASQILEPQLCGLLSRFSKRILIGDHKQLPAVVQQDTKYTTITDDDLIQNGFMDVSHSLFDRMYSQYQKNRWHHAFGILSQQGRMHISLQKFVDVHFYENKLTPLPHLKRLTEESTLFSGKNKSFLQNRTLFIDSPVQYSVQSKVNVYESMITVLLLFDLIKNHKEKNQNITSSSFGIITPFRAQISKITTDIKKYLPEYEAYITVDTVERYQGGARDIILFSTCVNNVSQLQRITSLGVDGTDRKLNVSLTRAREQFIMIGSKSLLEKQTAYAAWINHAHQLSFSEFKTIYSQEITVDNMWPESETEIL
jgi:DNA replication ATP-dependent helicase Dna2